MRPVARVRRFELRRTPPRSEDDPAAYMDRLAELAGALRDVPWLLAGGLAIPVTLGTFYRRHDDIDIAYPVDAFERVEAAMARAGFYLSTHFPLSLFGTLRCALHVPLRAAAPFARGRLRKLAFRDASGRRPAGHLLATIDALPYRIRDGRFETCDGRYRLALDHPVEGARVATAGAEIPCLDLHYVGLIKERLQDPKHAVDLGVIREARRRRAAHAHP